MWSIARRLKQSWTHWPLWTRAFLILIVLCISVQGVFSYSLWTEAQFRARVKSEGRFILGPSPLSTNLDRQLRRWIGPKRTELFYPIIALRLIEPSERDLASIASHRQLRSLEIISGSLNPTAVQRIGSLPELTDFYLDDVALDANSLSGLADSPQLTRIKFVGKVTAEALEPLKNCSTLRELHLGERFSQALDGASVTGQHLAAVAKIPHLKYLIVVGDRLPDTDLRYLASAWDLEALVVDDVRLQTGAINVLGNLRRLQQLELYPPYGEPPSKPPPLKGFLALQSLSLRSARISPQLMASLAKLPKLEALSLQQCEVDESLYELSRARKLRFLDLDLSDATLSGFQKIGRMNSLEALTLGSIEDMNAIRNQCPNAISQAKLNHPKYFDALEWFRVGESPRMGGGFF